MVIGILFRLLFMQFQGLSNDELSAWYRTRFVDWNSFWHIAVKTGDMHPFFYQAFLHYWVTLFGDSEFALRATGLLFYLLNSFLIYRICTRFFSKNTGLAIITVYCCLTFTIINTTVARPYNSGTFFLLLTFWSILEVNILSKKFSLWHVGIIAGMLGAMTSHYFAFLTAGLMGIIGLVYLKKERKKDLIICGILTVLFFLPHWPVTEFQLSVGGLGWLPAPEFTWLLDLAHIFFNKSWITALILIFSLWQIQRVKENQSASKEDLFALAIFLTTYLIAHILSVFYTPILRDIVSLFILPFLFIFLFRKFKNVADKKIVGFILLIPLVTGVDSVVRGDLLQPKNFGVFREIGDNINKYETKNGLKNCTTVSNYNNVDYLNYYTNHTFKETLQDWSSPEATYQLSEISKKSKNARFMYTWSNSVHIPMYYEVILHSFPVTIESSTYFNSAYRVYKKGKRKLIEQKNILKSISNSIQSSDEFIGECRIDLKDILAAIQPEQYILLKARGKLSNSSTVLFVATLEREGVILANDEDQPLLYQTFDQAKLIEIGKKDDFYIAFDLPKEAVSTDVLKIYLWNQGKQKVEIEQPRIYFIDK